MSIEVMTLVFKRYPAGGNERLLALAIADHARPDGTHVYPSVALLADMTRQSERSVQRLILEMLKTGWLQLVRKSTGRRGDTNEYRICPQWLAGGDSVPPEKVPDRITRSKGTGDKLAPVQSVEKVGVDPPKLSTTGDTTGLTGDTAVSPNPSGPGIPIPPLPPVGTGGCGQQAGQPDAGSRKDRRRWRWADRREGIETRGRELGLGVWDEMAVVGRELFTDYAARVFVAHLAEAGITVTRAQVLMAMGANSSSWSTAVRWLVEAAKKETEEQAT